MFAVYIAAPNDQNGNPRRGYIICGPDGRDLDFIDEGLEGNKVNWPTTHRIPVTATYYNRLRRIYG